MSLLAESLFYTSVKVPSKKQARVLACADHKAPTGGSEEETVAAASSRLLARKVCMACDSLEAALLKLKLVLWSWKRDFFFLSVTLNFEDKHVSYAYNQKTLHNLNFTECANH